MTTLTINMKSKIEEYNKAFELSNKWKRFDTQEISFSELNEDKEINMVIGRRNMGCEIGYKIEKDTLNVVTFNPIWGGYNGTFSDEDAQAGLEYLFGLAAVLDVEFLNIVMPGMDKSDYKIFRNYGFVARQCEFTDSTTFIRQIPVPHDLFHPFQDKYFELMRSLRNCKRKTSFSYKFSTPEYKGTTKMLTYNISYDFEGGVFKGVLSLNIDSTGIFLYESSNDFKLYLDKDKTMNDNVLNFLEVLFTLKWFNEEASKVLKVNPKHYTSICTHLQNVYCKDNLTGNPARSIRHAKVKSISEFVDTEDEVVFLRIDDVYLICEASTNSVSSYSIDKENEGKTKFSELVASIQQKRMQQSLEAF